jgi:radical SAM protein with 4Fe4S-binding SPASM domain
MLAIIDQLALALVPRLQVTGGEPLLREDLFDVLRYAADKYLITSLTSNGYYLNEETANSFAKVKVSVVQISLDGPAYVHNVIRGNLESYTRAIEAIKVLRKYPQITVGVSTTVMPQNLESLPELKDLLISHKLDYWSLGIVMPTGKAKHNQSLFLNPEQFGFLLKFIKQSQREIPIEFAENFPYLGKLDHQIRRSPKICPVGILSCCIGVDGQVRGCSDQSSSDTYSEGDLRKEPFIEIWQKGFQRYRTQEVLEKDSNCRLCISKSSCRGGCWVMREKNLHCYMNYIQ